MSNGVDSKKVDWSQLRQRLQQAEEAQYRARHPTSEQARQILAQRAAALAIYSDKGVKPVTETEVLVFSLGASRFAIGSLFVRKIRPLLLPLLPLPGGSRHLRGLTAEQGEMVAVFDLAGLLGVAASNLAAGASLLLLGEKQTEFAVVVDEVHDVQGFNYQSLSLVGDQSADYPLLAGTTACGLVVIDGKALLKDPRCFVSDVDALPVAADDAER